MLSLLLSLTLATAVSPQTRPAKFIDTYPADFHERTVSACVETLTAQNPDSSIQMINALCDCTFWNVEDHFTFKQFIALPDDQKITVVFAAINGCAIHLGQKDKS